VRFLLIII